MSRTRVRRSESGAHRLPQPVVREMPAALPCEAFHIKPQVYPTSTQRPWDAPSPEPCWWAFRDSLKLCAPAMRFTQHGGSPATPFYKIFTPYLDLHNIRWSLLKRTTGLSAHIASHCRVTVDTSPNLITWAKLCVYSKAGLLGPNAFEGLRLLVAPDQKAD